MNINASSLSPIDTKPAALMCPPHPMPAPRFLRTGPVGSPVQHGRPGTHTGNLAAAAKRPSPQDLMVAESGAVVVTERQVLGWVDAEGPHVSLARLAGLIHATEKAVRDVVERSPLLWLDPGGNIALKR